MQTDNLSGFHSNTHIPVVVGAQMRYEVTGDELYKVPIHHNVYWSSDICSSILHGLLIANSGDVATVHSNCVQ